MYLQAMIYPKKCFNNKTIIPTTIYYNMYFCYIDILDINNFIRRCVMKNTYNSNFDSYISFNFAFWYADIAQNIVTRDMPT